MRSFAVAILFLVSAALAAPAVVPKANVGYAVFCTDINYGGSCVEVVEPASTVPYNGGCANTTPPVHQEHLERARRDRRIHLLPVPVRAPCPGTPSGSLTQLFAWVSDYSELNCGGTRLVISGQIPDFRVASVNFNDKAQSWSCGSAL
ncbi:hypothetical protein B0H14DRAFT_3659123 [Mycena olivaceomarginata]|nr:hypothetical protein B0H14DRAFT_3659123 [Mycena olivaceomarginata]